MSTALAGAVELLDRSLAYTRGALAGVQTVHLGLPTPCRGWSLERLLIHMADALDAYGEAATGRVGLAPGLADGLAGGLAGGGGPAPLEAIREKACALLGWWLDHPPDEVVLGDHQLASPTLVAAAALEIAVHGWDVHAALGRPVAVPDTLARPLLTIAESVVGAQDRAGCFAPRIAAAAGATGSEQLLAYVGRS